MPEGPVNMPYGDAFIVQTPTLDRVGQQLQQANIDRQRYAQSESTRMDGLLNKELANVRSVDMPQVMDAYQQWSQLSKRSLFDKSIQNNPQRYNALQVEKNAAMGNVLGMINKSSQYNALGKQLGTNMQSKPDNYSDEASKMLSTYYNTPMDQLTAGNYNGKPMDFTDVEQYRYKGGADLSKAHKSGIGKMMTHYDNGTTDATGIQTTQHGYQYGNTPLEYRNAYLPEVAGNKTNRSARFNWAQHSSNQDELDNLDIAYQNSPNWKKMGIAPQQLPPYNPNDPVGNEATYQAKQYLVGMNPAEVKAATVTNQGAKMNLQFDHQKTMEAIRQGGRVQLKELGHAYKKMDKQEQDSKLDEIYDGMIEGSKEEKDKEGNVKPISPKFYKSADGQIRKQWELKSSAFIKDELALPNAKGHKIPPDKVMLEENGDILPIYYERGEDDNGNEVIKKDKNGSYAVDMEKSRPVTQAEIKAVIGKKLVGVKEANRSSTPGAASPSPIQPAAAPIKTKLPKNAFD